MDMEKQGPDLPSYLKNQKDKSKTKNPTRKPHERMVFETLNIRHQRTVISERWKQTQ